MNRQDYIEQIKADIKTYISENDVVLFDEDGELDETAKDQLYDTLWVEDSVTGNASGSYTFSRAKAHDNVQGANDVIRELVEEFGIEAETVAEKFLDEEWEWWDVSIRCYLLGEALEEAVEELEEERQ